VDTVYKRFLTYSPTDVNELKRITKPGGGEEH